MDTPQKDQKEKKKRGHALYLIIIGILSVLCTVLAWQYWEQRNRTSEVIVIRDQVQAERNQVQEDLVKLKEQFSTLQTDNKQMKQELEEKKAQIDDLIAQAEKHKNDAYIINRLKKETETLRTIMKHFVHQIDSLNKLNDVLVVEKEKVKTELKDEKGKTETLTKEKEQLQNTVALGQLLKANSVTAKAVFYRSGGKKEVETEKSGKAQKIRVGFTLGENRIAKSGNKDIYIRVITPDGKELAQKMDDDHQFRFNGSKGFWAGKKTIDYRNEDTQVFVYCDKVGDKFAPGKYIIEVNADEATIGQATLTLK